MGVFNKAIGEKTKTDLPNELNVPRKKKLTLCYFPGRSNCIF